jgi:hypothetical protein
MVMAIGGCSNTNDGLSPKSVGGTPPGEQQQQSADNSNVSLDETKAQVVAPVEFTVPAIGGSVKVTGKSGIEVEFAVPASAAGKKITFTPTTAAEIGWSDHNFAEVIRMEPDGSKFAEPIIVRPSSKALIVLDFPSSPSKSAPEGLQLNPAGDGFLLYHFSTLVVFSPDYDCESQEGWIAADAREQAETCTDPANPVMLKLNCLTHPYCLQIDAQCCAPMGATTCDVASPTLSLSYSRADESGDEYAYCIAKEESNNTVSSSVCKQYTVAACECGDGSAGSKECLKDETGWGECSCAGDVSNSDSTAICPEWHEGDCSVTDALSCGCSTSDGDHTYTVSCDNTTGCDCKVDDVVIANFSFEESACMGPDQIRERWFVHCSQGACP